MSESTNLAIAEIGVPLYSSRGLSQTLEPIPAAASMRRTVNGALVDISATQFRKYRSTIACTDMDSPALDGIWPGMTLTVDCIVELSYPDDTDGAPARTVVAATRSEDGFVFYRPRITFKVVDYQIDKDEWGAEVGWRLDLEEV